MKAGATFTDGPGMGSVAANGAAMIAGGQGNATVIDGVEGGCQTCMLSAAPPPECE